MAYEISKGLEKQGETKLLHQLNLSVEAKDRERNKKVDYMHANPCCGKWNLVTDVTAYMPSSARFYLCGEQGIYPAMSYIELDDIDSTKNLSD